MLIALSRVNLRTRGREKPHRYSLLVFFGMEDLGSVANRRKESRWVLQLCNGGLTWGLLELVSSCDGEHGGDAHRISACVFLEEKGEPAHCLLMRCFEDADAQTTDTDMITIFAVFWNRRAENCVEEEEGEGVRVGLILLPQQRSPTSEETQPIFFHGKNVSGSHTYLAETFRPPTEEDSICCSLGGFRQAALQDNFREAFD
jgi:hypothetical protein